MNREYGMEPLRTHPDLPRLLGNPTFKIKDTFLDLPKRVTVINGDDILNLQILLATTKTVDEFLERI